jgi:hypothetical protein
MVLAHPIDPLSQDESIRKRIFSEEKEYCFASLVASPLSEALAGLKRLLVQLDHLRLADHSHERSDPLRQLRSDVACWSTPATRAIRIRLA